MGNLFNFFRPNATNSAPAATNSAPDATQSPVNSTSTFNFSSLKLGLQTAGENMKKAVLEAYGDGKTLSHIALTTGKIIEMIPVFDKIGTAIAGLAKFNIDRLSYNRIKETVFDPIQKLKYTLIFLTELNKITQKMSNEATDKINVELNKDVQEIVEEAQEIVKDASELKTEEIELKTDEIKLIDTTQEAPPDAKATSVATPETIPVATHDAVAKLATIMLEGKKDELEGKKDELEKNKEELKKNEEELKNKIKTEQNDLIELLKSVNSAQVSQTTIDNITKKLDEILDVLTPKSTAKNLAYSFRDKIDEMDVIMKTMENEMQILMMQYSTFIFFMGIGFAKIDPSMPSKFLEEIIKTEAFKNFVSSPTSETSETSKTSGIGITDLTGLLAVRGGGSSKRRKTRKTRKTKSKKNRRPNKKTRK